jgi:hypothetical protein
VYVKQQIACAVFAALTLAAPAAAEPMRPVPSAAPGVLPPYEIVTIIRSTGLDPLGRPIRRGPHYVLYAVGDDDREVRVLVNARSGKIVSLTPVETASRLPPGAAMERYEPMPSAGYIPPGRPELYEAEPPDIYEGERPVVYEGRPPVIYGPRPPAEVPMATPPRRPATSPERADAPAVSSPRVITAIEPGRAGLLPPPPERFPQRVPAVAANPKPVKRAVAALPKQPPLPKPRPGISAAPSPPSAASKSAAEQLPN